MSFFELLKTQSLRTINGTIRREVMSGSQKHMYFADFVNFIYCQSQKTGSRAMLLTLTKSTSGGKHQDRSSEERNLVGGLV